MPRKKATGIDVSGSFARPFASALLSWSEENGRDFPWRHTKDPYEVLVAELLLIQTFAAKVVPVYIKFLEEYPEPKKAARGSPEKMERIVYPLGLLNRARRIKEICTILVRQYSGIVPDDEAKLLSLPGVGLYTARATLCFAFEKDVAILDANIMRIFGRVFGISNHGGPGCLDRGTWEFAESILYRKEARRYNYALLDFGAVVCKHYNPSCHSCCISKICNHAKEHEIDGTLARR